MTIAVSIGFGLGTQRDQVDIEPLSGFILFEVLANDFIDSMVSDGDERGAQRGSSSGNLGLEGIGEERDEGGRRGRNVEVERMLDGQPVIGIG